MELPKIYECNNIISNNQDNVIASTNKIINKVDEFPIRKKITITTKNNKYNTFIVGVTKYYVVTHNGLVIPKKDIINID